MQVPGKWKDINTKDVIHSLKSGQLGYLGIDVYEQEAQLFFHDLSENVIQDDVILRLLSFPNVLITSHQAFLTDEALLQIAQVTLQNISDFEQGRVLENELWFLWWKVKGELSEPHGIGGIGWKVD